MICRCLSNKHLTCYGEVSGQRGRTGTQEHWTALTNFSCLISPHADIAFSGMENLRPPKPGSSGRCGAAPCPGTGPPEGMGDFGGRGSPPGLAHTQGRDRAEHPPSSQGMCRDFLHCQARRWQIWHKGCQCLHSKIAKICLWECHPSFARVCSGEIMF